MEIHFTKLHPLETEASNHNRHNLLSKVRRQRCQPTFAMALSIARISDMILWCTASTERMLFTSHFKLSCTPTQCYRNCLLPYTLCLLRL